MLGHGLHFEWQGVFDHAWKSLNIFSVGLTQFLSRFNAVGVLQIQFHYVQFASQS